MKGAEGVEEDMAMGGEGWVAGVGATRVSGSWSFCCLKACLVFYVWVFGPSNVRCGGCLAWVIDEQSDFAVSLYVRSLAVLVHLSVPPGC